MKKTVDNLYIHIPFCARKCGYCDFYSIPFRPDSAREYLDALRREMELRKDVVASLKTVYIGGGTPTILAPESIAAIFEAVREHFTFQSDVMADAEITVEANPGTAAYEKLKAVRSAGANRISIGVQSLDQDELAALGRSHSCADALDAAGDARRAGFGNISVDLIYGIPGQTMCTWEHTLARVLAMDPEHISAYELTPEQGTPLSEDLRSGRVRLPEEDLVRDMYYRVIDVLEDRGYVHYEISNFAKPGRECLHNLNYWERGGYLGIGAGAHSFVNGKRTGTARDISAYTEGMKHDRVPLAEESVVSDEDAFREFVFLGMRKTAGIDIGAVPGEGPALKDEAVKDLVRHGLIEMNGHRLRLTRKGLILSNEVFVKLF